MAAVERARGRCDKTEAAYQAAKAKLSEHESALWSVSEKMAGIRGHLDLVKKYNAVYFSTEEVVHPSGESHIGLTFYDSEGRRIILNEGASE